MQAMVHELLGIQDNRVDLTRLPKVPKDLQEVVLSSHQDAFFKSNMFENFGDLGANIKKLVDEFQQKAQSNQNIQSLEDMVKFVENYPEYRKQHGNVSKHVTMMTELSRIVDERQLMAISQIEQELACTAGQAAAFEAVLTQLNNEKTSDIDRLRIVMLYALRYERESPQTVEQLITHLRSWPSKYKPGLVHTLLRQAGFDKRTGDLYGNRDLFNKARNMARGLKGVENVYTQHQPLLAQTIESIMRGRLRDIDYPFVGNHFQQGRPQDVVVFIVGGTTYEEARTVHLLNATQTGTRVILGGSVVQNSSSFLNDLEEVQRFQ
jgi:vacuolar protein sorting-associated protein 45